MELDDNEYDLDDGYDEHAYYLDGRRGYSFVTVVVAAGAGLLVGALLYASVLFVPNFLDSDQNAWAAPTATRSTKPAATAVTCRDNTVLFRPYDRYSSRSRR